MNSSRTQEIIEGARGENIDGVLFLYITSTSSQVPREAEIEISLLVMLLIVPKTLTKLPKAENDMSRKSSIYFCMWFLTPKVYSQYALYHIGRPNYSPKHRQGDFKSVFWSFLILF